MLFKRFDEARRRRPVHFLVCISFSLRSVFVFVCRCVCQVIDLADERQLGLILAQLSEQLPALRRCTYGKHILVRLERATGHKL